MLSIAWWAIWLKNESIENILFLPLFRIIDISSHPRKIRMLENIEYSACMVEKLVHVGSGAFLKKPPAQFLC